MMNLSPRPRDFGFPTDEPTNVSGEGNKQGDSDKKFTRFGLGDLFAVLEQFTQFGRYRENGVVVVDKESKK